MHDAIMSRVYRSPLTGDAWPDPRPAVGTLVGLATMLNEIRPRRKPPEGHDAAIAAASVCAATYAGIARIQRFGPGGITFEQGAQISEAYWQAKEAKQKLQRLVDDGFLQRQEWQGDAWQRAKQYADDHGNDGAWARSEVGRYTPVPASARAARLAWYAANLTEKAAAGADEEMDTYSYAHRAILGALAELEQASVPQARSAAVERIWRFVVAAGRMPMPGVDDDLLAAFEAALMAGEADFARHLAKEGWGQGTGGSGVDGGTT